MFCFVLAFITFNDLSPYSSFPFSFPFLDHLYDVKVLLTSTRVSVMQDDTALSFFSKLWGLEIQRNRSNCSPALLHIEH